MRGRTLNDSFIILDEAQNTTAEQMKMFLTRLGFGSRAVVTGDVTQIDLPDGRGRSGLLQVRKVLADVPSLTFVELGSRDVVRHKIVQDIVDAYAAMTRAWAQPLTAQGTLGPAATTPGPEDSTRRPDAIRH